MVAPHLKIDVKTKETKGKMFRDVSKLIEMEMNERLSRAAKTIKRNLGTVLIGALKSQPEYASLVGGDLKEHFGLTDVPGKLIVIFDTWVKTIKVMMKKIRFTGTSPSLGGLKIEAVRSDFADVLALGESYQVTEKGEALHWLQWLLLAGDRVIIRDYVIAEGGAFKGRAGPRIMRSKAGGAWSVPLGFRGTEINNWTTRAINAAGREFDLLFQEAFY